ncbi:LAGLIDADG family homing endonuclease [Ureibacillus aquaedulcis]|uniref:Homing endonuclease LAGLIDADG domain-containing protein n=1 Tax=Ureibacillus aquaedulcis TaxID=3058421 RepID=A0ABT8GMF2_9BACL|nr:LAGLIDADG family homing endonuclease [Ureibacillus sp. BA0131]MDN4492587.1 hypothetical protein [Ureibacillus sp. BA0131]
MAKDFDCIILLNVIIKHKVPVNREQSSAQPRKHRVNEDFFKVRSHEMTWVLGLCYRTVSENAHSINFVQKDERILKIVAKYMEADYVIQGISKTRTVPILVINSRELKKDLAGMGISSNKSLTLPFPEVPEAYLGSFIRGVMDGDGHVASNGYTLNVTTGSNSFALGLLVNSYISEDTSSGFNTIYRVRVSGKKDLIHLSELLYEHANDDDFHFYKRVYISQHSKKPFIMEDDRSNKGWEIIDG